MDMDWNIPIIVIMFLIAYCKTPFLVLPKFSPKLLSYVWSKLQREGRNNDMSHLLTTVTYHNNLHDLQLQLSSQVCHT